MLKFGIAEMRSEEMRVNVEMMAEEFDPGSR
jgi:hypothetical protein